eukprot:GHVO01013112.1.p1 GENE.GHVO01013112.1~~GHVO01013112.1.p1  ORF type:complete len:107 (-),score=22.97 GHVO01013112.1:125-445(-)
MCRLYRKQIVPKSFERIWGEIRALRKDTSFEHSCEQPASRIAFLRLLSLGVIQPSSYKAGEMKCVTEWTIWKLPVRFRGVQSYRTNRPNLPTKVDQWIDKTAIISQ